MTWVFVPYSIITVYQCVSKKYTAPTDKADMRNVRNQNVHIGIENRSVSRPTGKCHFWCSRIAGKRREE
jgi:hypothetical protein